MAILYQSYGNLWHFSIFIQGYIAFPEATGDQVREMPKVSIALVQDSQTKGERRKKEESDQNDNDTARGNRGRKRTKSNTPRFKASRRKTVSITNRQQNITSVGDIERNGKVDRFQMSC